MSLGQLILELEAYDLDLTAPVGFTKPHAYIGKDGVLAFEPAARVTVAAMVDSARSALGLVFSSSRSLPGFRWTVSIATDVVLARGVSCESLGPTLLAYMFGHPELALDPKT